ncbi:MAG TPA: winged helix-turn-helix domain-containing protein [Jiangellaceae bacterium]
MTTGWRLRWGCDGLRFVSESALTSRIKSARQAIGDTGRERRLIRTVHGRGYQFVGEVTESSAPEPLITDPPSQHIRFCKVPDGTRLAYATMGAVRHW